MKFDFEDDFNDELLMIIPADRTYYVAQTGDNNRSGLTPADAWATLPHAMDVIGGFLVPSNVTVTVQLLDGTIEVGDTVIPPVIDGQLIIQGNSATPANVIVSLDGTATGFSMTGTARVTLQDFSFNSVAAGATGFNCEGGSILKFGNIIFGDNFTNIIVIRQGAVVTAISNFTISGDCSRFVSLVGQGQFDCNGRTLTLLSTPVWAAEFIICSGGYARFDGFSFSGSATGQRYEVNQNGVIFTNGGGASFLPGNAAGAAATGGQYI